MESENGVEPVDAPKHRFRWLWWVAAWFLWTFLGDELLEAVWSWLIAVGGYGLTNAVSGLIALSSCFVVLIRTRVRHRQLETQGDPEPLPATTDYVTTALPMVVLCWLVGVGAWGVTVLLVALAGFGSAWVLGPIIGTAFILGARMESAHARTMDARRGMPPAAAART
ncbi:hypothetical protein [Kocuria flava]|uniref:hypothetical protein n=1 Tax=Kocuria flava TaxID=446860 RepID=UPI002F93A55D